MKCKYCQEEMPERGHFCPICGMDNSIDPEDIPQQEAADAAAEPAEQAPSHELKKSKRIAAVVCCVAVLAVLGTVLFFGIRGGWDFSGLFDWQIFRENDLYYKDSYTVSDKKAVSKKDVVVATMGDVELTNGQLQVYYWSEFYDFFNNYYYYLSYFGLDYTAPLDKQTSYDGTGTWQQSFLQSALEMWQSNQAFALEAKANGFTLPQEYQQKLDTMMETLEADALEGGFESADALTQDSFGPGCTAQDYADYMETYYYGYLYFAELYDAIAPTMEEIEAYFAANEEAFKTSGITKDSGYTVDVRHILIDIDSFAATQGEGDENTDTEEAQWAACLAEAERILVLWQENPTEAYFAELANEYSADPDSNEAGGLYSGVAEGDMLTNFNDWCFDAVRVIGDYGIVKTQHGYHIMYFSGSEDIWVTETRNAILSEGAQEIVNDILEKYQVEINYKNIVLGEVTFG